jgi:PadR family transcriptional regulator PadR
LAYERLFEKLTKENLWIYILSILKEGPDYALSLRRRVKDRFGFVPAKITFYFVLYRMEREGLVNSSKEQGRRLYRATGKGLDSFDRALSLLTKTANALKS